MSNTITKFLPKITKVEQTNGELRFVLSGDDKYGLDKSIVNGIRRVLLTDIPTVGFNLTESGVNNDINVVTLYFLETLYRITSNSACAVIFL